MIDQLIVVITLGIITLAFGAALGAAVIDVIRGGASRGDLAGRMRAAPLRTILGLILAAGLLLFLVSLLSASVGGPSIFR